MPSEPVTTEMVEQLRRAATQVEMCRNRASLECLAGWEPRIMRAAADLIASILPSRDAEAMGYERGLEDAVKEMIADLEMACEMIQEAKGFEGEQGGPSTNNLDFAEHWINKTISTLALKRTPQDDR